MKLIATNIANPTTIEWKGKEVQTGIFKNSVAEGVYLTKVGVKGDSVINTKVHGGIDKACYLFSVDHYDFWRKQYPDLNWSWGMFGENLSVKGFDETKIHIGDVFELGQAIIQVSQPRIPCYKLGVKFKNQDILSQYLASTNSGAYVRVLKEGKVVPGDNLYLLERVPKSLTLAQVYEMYTPKKRDSKLIDRALKDDNLADSIKKYLLRFHDNPNASKT